MKVLLAAIMPLVLSAHTVRAADFAPALQAFVDSSVRGFAADAVVIEAILAANAARSELDQAEIDALDANWRAEVGQLQMPTVTSVLQNAAADYLRTQIEASAGAITEIFIMDASGLNVAATSATSDMWQGDEDKFVKTFLVGPGAVFIDSVELDESTQTYQGQVSLSVVDPATNAVIGAITVGVNAESLM